MVVKSDFNKHKRNIACKECEKQFIEEKSDETLCAKTWIEFEKLFFSKKEIQQTSCGITCVKRFFLKKELE